MKVQRQEERVDRREASAGADADRWKCAEVTIGGGAAATRVSQHLERLAVAPSAPMRLSESKLAIGAGAAAPAVLRHLAKP